MAVSDEYPIYRECPGCGVGYTIESGDDMAEYREHMMHCLV